MKLSSRNEISSPLENIAEPATCDDAYFSGFIVLFRLLMHKFFKKVKRFGVSQPVGQWSQRENLKAMPIVFTPLRDHS